MQRNIRIILVETSHSGNIGSAARAMKTMGLNQLYLVAPKQPIDDQTLALAAGADDVLKNATIVDHFEQAIADCELVIGTSARLRHLQNTLIDARKCGEKTIQFCQTGKVALVFGRERVGLTNKELLKCHYHLNIPTNPDYSSLNLAMAVQLVCYEIRMAWLADKKNYFNKENANLPLSSIENPYPKSLELEHFFNHTEHLYKQLGFIKNQGVIQKLRRLYQRAKIEKTELNILQGMLTAVEKQLATEQKQKIVK